MSASHHPTACLFLALLPLVAAGELSARPRRPKIDPLAPTLELKPFVVKDEPVTSFGLSLSLMVVRSTGRISKLVIRSVAEESEAYQQQHLRAGMEILAVDGIDVRTMEGRIDPGSDFNRLFMNRKRGDRIVLTLSRGPGRFPRMVELIEWVRPRRSPWDR